MAEQQQRRQQEPKPAVDAFEATSAAALQLSSRASPLDARRSDRRLATEHGKAWKSQARVERRVPPEYGRRIMPTAQFQSKISLPHTRCRRFLRRRCNSCLPAPTYPPPSPDTRSPSTQKPSQLLSNVPPILWLINQTPSPCLHPLLPAPHARQPIDSLESRI